MIQSFPIKREFHIHTWLRAITISLSLFFPGYTLMVLNFLYKRYYAEFGHWETSNISNTLICIFY